MKKLLYSLSLIGILSSCGSYNYWGVSNGWGTTKAKPTSRTLVDTHQENGAAHTNEDSESTKDLSENPTIKQAKPANTLRAAEALPTPGFTLQKTEDFTIHQDDTSEVATEAEQPNMDEEPVFTDDELDQAYWAEKQASHSKVFGILGLIMLIIPITSIIGLAMIISSLIFANRALSSLFITSKGLRIASNWRTISLITLCILLIPVVILLFFLLAFLGFW